MSRHYRFVLHNSELVTSQELTMELPDQPEYNDLIAFLNQPFPAPHLAQILTGLIGTIRNLQKTDNGYGFELHYLQRSLDDPYVAFNGKEYLTKEEFENG